MPKQWEGYIVESKKFVNPVGFKEWIWFLSRLPIKVIQMYWGEYKHIREGAKKYVENNRSM